MEIISTETGERYEVVIEPLEKTDYASIKESKLFSFNWNLYKRKEVYKLRLTNDSEILGLLHVIQHPENGYEFLEIVALESSKDNVGNTKKYDRIAGCLLAFASRLSFIYGFDGFVMLVSKTEITQHYENKYGYQNIGRIGTQGDRMKCDDNNSRALIKEYIG